MLSSQVLVHGDTDAILDSGCLAVRRDRQITHIPLAAVGEVRPRGDKALDVMLTERCWLRGLRKLSPRCCSPHLGRIDAAGQLRLTARSTPLPRKSAVELGAVLRPAGAEHP
jgi:hypothetical protein